MNHELVGVRVVSSDEIDTAFHQAGDEMNVHGQSIELGDDQRGLGLLGCCDGRRKLRPIVALAALDFAEFTDQLAAIAANVAQHGLTLRIEAKAAPALPIGRDPKICNESPHATDPVTGKPTYACYRSLPGSQCYNAVALQDDTIALS
jgi:hypothetical protein